MDKGMLKEIAAKGRYGDTELVHVTPEEKALLKALGGAGTINPETGLEEYFSIGGFNPFNVNTWTDPVKDVAKVVVGGVTKVADDVLGIDDSGGIVGSVKKIGDKIWDGLTEVGDELKKISENPYVQAAVAIAFPQYAAYVNAAVKLNSGEKLNAADIAAVAASAGQQDFADGLKLSKSEIKNITKAAKVVTAKNPGKAFLTTFGADVAQEVGFADAFDKGVQNTLGQDALDVLKQNENYIVDSARFATGDISEKELVAKYGAGAVDYATSGTAAQDYNDYIVDTINVGLGNKGIEDVIADKYGEDIVGYLGAETENERALGLGGLTTATQLAMGKDPLEAAYSGTKRAYDEGARLEDLTFTTNQVAGLDFSLNDIIPDLGIKFGDLSGRGYTLPSLAGFDVDLNLLDIQAPDILSADVSLPEVADLGLDLGSIDFSGYKTSDIGDYNLKELGDLGIDVNKLDLMPEFQMIGLAQILEPTTPVGMDLKDDEELASLQSEFDITSPEDTLFSREVLARTGKLA